MFGLELSDVGDFAFSTVCATFVSTFLIEVATLHLVITLGRFFTDWLDTFIEVARLLARSCMGILLLLLILGQELGSGWIRSIANVVALLQIFVCHFLCDSPLPLALCFSFFINLLLTVSFILVSFSFFQICSNVSSF